jgi:hypothetical protein
VLVGLFVVTVLAWWAQHEGGFAPGQWYPGALLLLAVVVVVVRPADLRGLPARRRWSLPLLAAFTAWSFLSIAWADARGDAWDAANRALLYLTVFALFAGLRWKRAEAAIFLAAFALATAVAGAWEVVDALAGDASDAFVGGRLAGPIGYENASAALYGAAFWPALVLAAGRFTPRLARGVLLASAGLLLDFCVLAQSRGSLIALTAALLCAVALSRERVRLLVALAAVAVTTLVSLPALLAVFNHPPEQGGDVLDSAAIAIGLSGLVLFVAGLSSTRLDDRTPARRPHPVSHVVWAAAAAAVVLAAGALAASSRFTAGVESGRYDFWRVALMQLADHPLQGAGAGNFADDYARERHRHEQPLYPHSIVLGTFGQTGIVGGSLLLGFLATALLSALTPRDTVGVAAAASAVAWLAHASIDWLWEIPAVTVPAMACLGLVVGSSQGVTLPALRAERGLVAAAAVVAGVSYALPALAAREIERAVRRWDHDPAAALRALDRARRLNPLSDRADLVTGALALQRGDRARARRAFQRATGRDDADWYPYAALGVLDLEDQHPQAALAQLERAQRMNPLERSLGDAIAAARHGAVQPPPEVEAQLTREALPGPLGRRPITCRPVLGMAADCVREEGA